MGVSGKCRAKALPVLQRPWHPLSAFCPYSHVLSSHSMIISRPWVSRHVRRKQQAGVARSLLWPQLQRRSLYCTYDGTVSWGGRLQTRPWRLGLPWWGRHLPKEEWLQACFCPPVSPPLETPRQSMVLCRGNTWEGPGGARPVECKFQLEDFVVIAAFVYS